MVTQCHKMQTLAIQSVKILWFPHLTSELSVENTCMSLMAFLVSPEMSETLLVFPEIHMQK